MQQVYKNKKINDTQTTKITQEISACAYFAVLTPGRQLTGFKIKFYNCITCFPKFTDA